jgi:hypothetical protein
MSTDTPSAPDDDLSSRAEPAARVADLERSLAKATAADDMKKRSIIATKGTLDMAYPPLILASTAATFGYDVQHGVPVGRDEVTAVADERGRHALAARDRLIDSTPAGSAPCDGMCRVAADSDETAAVLAVLLKTATDRTPETGRRRTLARPDHPPPSSR